MYVLYVCIMLPFIAHLSFQNFLFFYITAHIHKRYVNMYIYIYKKNMCDMTANFPGKMSRQILKPLKLI